jgi:hypothetical protein
MMVRMKIKALASIVVVVAIADLAFVLRDHYRATSANIQQLPGPANGVSQKEKPLATAGNPVVEADRPVTFQIEKSQPIGKGTSWTATYTGDGHLAKFRIEFDPPRGGSSPKNFPLAYGDGHIYPIVGSDSTSLLIALKIELEAHKVPIHPKHVVSLPFTYAVLGEHDSKIPGGGFDANPPGDWIEMKIFLGAETEEDEGEVFLNLNPTTGEAEFSMKDADYGDIVLRYLAAVL